jgi:hypothetical protein
MRTTLAAAALLAAPAVLDVQAQDKVAEKGQPANRILAVINFERVQ